MRSDIQNELLIRNNSNMGNLVQYDIEKNLWASTQFVRTATARNFLLSKDFSALYKITINTRLMICTPLPQLCG
jgi:hypothetical protein